MKLQLVIAIALISVNAFATRARMQALGGSPHLLDPQGIYYVPQFIMAIQGDFVTLESGATDSGTASTDAQGMLVRTMGDAKMGLSLGNHSISRTFVTATTTTTNQQNPIEFTYGSNSGNVIWAGTLVYSNFQNKTVGLAAGALQKESSMAARFGAMNGVWGGVVQLGFTDTATLGNDEKYTGAPAVSVLGLHWVDSMMFLAYAGTSGAKVENATGTQLSKFANTTVKLGVTNSHKKDGNELFYNAILTQSTTTISSTPDLKNTSLTLPITIGLEVDASSWLTLRGSVMQTTLINNTKNEAPASETAPGGSSTTFAAGAGLKFNKIIVDGTLLAGAGDAQKLNSSSLLGQVGMTYSF